MRKSYVKEKLRYHGVVHTEVDTGDDVIRVIARGPQFPADQTNGANQSTEVVVKKNGHAVERVEKPTRERGALAFLEFVEEYGDGT